MDRPVYWWECPKCHVPWPTKSEKKPNSYIICPICTYAKAASMARKLRELGHDPGDIDS